MAGRRDLTLVLDTPSLYFRAFFGVPDTIKGPDGRPVNAVRGLLDFLAYLISTHRPSRLIAATDEDWRPAFRVAALPSYKAHRVAAVGAGGPDEETVPDDLTPQIPGIFDLLDAIGIARVGVPGFEADDVIGTVATRAEGPVDIVTGDRDLFQLVDDARRVRVLYTVRGVGRAEVIDEAAVHARYGIPGRAYADYAVLRGDPSDGLPGVKGIGEKSAAQLIRQYGGLPAILAALDRGDPALGAGPARKLAAGRSYLQVAPIVVAVRTDLELPDHDASLPVAPRDPERLLELVEVWGVDSAVGRVIAALTAVGA